MTFNIILIILKIVIKSLKVLIQEADLTKQEAYQNVFTEYPDVVTARDLAKMLGISIVKAYQLLKSGSIRCFRIGTEYRIPKVYVL